MNYLECIHCALLVELILIIAYGVQIAITAFLTLAPRSVFLAGLKHRNAYEGSCNPIALSSGVEVRAKYRGASTTIKLLRNGI